MPTALASSYLDKLNPEQRQAVEHMGGPLLVIAGAGSGKTNTLAHRVAHLLLHGADPGRILLLTFSRRAAAEMEPASWIAWASTSARSSNSQSRSGSGGGAGISINQDYQSDKTCVLV